MEIDFRGGYCSVLFNNRDHRYLTQFLESKDLRGKLSLASNANCMVVVPSRHTSQVAEECPHFLTVVVGRCCHENVTVIAANRD
jgi:hypothetical protein